MNAVYFFFVLFFFCFSKLFAQLSPLLKQAQRYYKEGKFTRAEILYRKALTKVPDNGKTAYNLGNTLYQLKQYQQAETYYLKALSKIKWPAHKAKVYFNLGNTYFKEQKYEKAKHFFQKALRLTPYDDKARYNFTLAKRFFQITHTFQDTEPTRSEPVDPLMVPSENSALSKLLDKERVFNESSSRDLSERKKEEAYVPSGQRFEKKTQLSPNRSRENSAYQDHLFKTLDEREREVQRKTIQRKLKEVGGGKNW